MDHQLSEPADWFCLMSPEPDSITNGLSRTEIGLLVETTREHSRLYSNIAVNNCIPRESGTKF